MKKVRSFRKALRKMLSCFMALSLSCSLAPMPSLAIGPEGAMTAAAVGSSGQGTLSVVKKGAPITSRNAGDTFPITVELESAEGLDLEAVQVSDTDFLSAPVEHPEASSGVVVPSVANVAAGVSEALSAAGPIAGAAGGLADASVPDGDGPLVALVDTGVPDCAGAVGRYSVVGGDGGDDNGHGTVMLGAILGENPDARIVSIKALDADGRGTAVGVRAAVRLAVRLGADVVNLSLAARDSVANAPIRAAVESALDSGCAVVAAAGNGGYDARYFTPANAPGAYTVGAADAAGHVLPDSNRGAFVDAFAVASSTSEAAARASGKLSLGWEGDWRAALAASGIAVDVGDEAYRFVGGDGAGVVAQIADEVIAAATKHTYDSSKENKTGSFTISVTGVGSATINLTDNNYGTTWKQAHKLKVVSSNTDLVKVTTTPVTTNTDNGASEYYRYFSMDFQVLMPAGTHGTGSSNDIDMLLGTAVGGINWASSASGLGAQNSAATWRTLKVRTQTGSVGMATSAYKLWTGAKLTISTAKDTYPVTYSGNVPYSGAAASGVPASQTKTYGTNLALQSGKPTVPAKAEAGYLVTYDADGGSCATASATAARSTTYAFKSWNTASNGTGTSYAAGATYAGNAALSLHAQWSPSTSTGSVTLPTPSRAGYSFSGWHVGSAAGALAGYGGAAYTPPSAVSLVAAWTENDRVVNYDGNGGTPVRTSDTVAPGASVTLPGVGGYPSDDMQDTGSSYTVTLSGNGGTVDGKTSSTLSSAQYRDYSFSGWYTAASGGIRVGGPGSSYTPTQGTTALYMQWSVAYRYRAVTLPVPVRAGFTFKGWSTTSSGTSGVTGSYTPTDDVTLYAVWTAHTRRVITVYPTAGQTAVLSGIPDGTTYKVTDGEQPRRWELVSESPQEGTIAPGDSVEVVSESRYTFPDDVQLDFTVPASIDFVARADGTLVGPSDGVLRIESQTDADIAVTGIQVRAGDGFQVVANPVAPGQVSFSFSLGGGAPISASDATGSGYVAVDWPISPLGSLAVNGVKGRVASMDDLGPGKHEMASIAWRLAIA